MAFRLIYITFAHKFGTEMKKICDYIAKWIGLMVLLVAALSVIVPASFVWIDTWAINPMLGVIMFGMGLTLSPHDFKIVLSRPKDILIGCLAQFTVMPLLAFGLTWAFSLPKELALGVILVGCCPGGTASNVITYLAKGDLALSVGMTATSTLLAPVLPSIINVKDEIEDFIAKGRINFPEECVLGNAICKVYNTPKPQPEHVELPQIDVARIRKTIDRCKDGYLEIADYNELLDAAGISRKKSVEVSKKEDALAFAKEVGCSKDVPLVMKVVGPLHKSDVGGVTLGVKDLDTVAKEFDRLIAIKDTYAVEMYPMLDGIDVYIGAIKDPKFGHQIFFGLGGIFIEVLKDVQSALAPITADEAKEMLKQLKGYKILQGVRGQEGVNLDLYADQVARVSALVQAAPEIAEMDLNPLLGNPRYVTAVDARIRIEK